MEFKTTTELDALSPRDLMIETTTTIITMTQLLGEAYRNLPVDASIDEVGVAHETIITPYEEYLETIYVNLLERQACQS